MPFLTQHYPYRLVMLCFLLPLLVGCSVASSAQPATLTVQHAPQNTTTYVAIGASDTFGIGADDPATESWPADLASQLGSKVRLVNLGIPGVTVENALPVELPVAIDAHPSLVTIWLAVNDLADNVPIATYAHDLDQIISQLQAANPQMRIALANIPDLTLLPHFSSSNPQTLRAQTAAYNQQITTIVQRHHVLLVDLSQYGHELASHPEYISSDGFHPSTLGYARIASIFYQVLQEKA